MSCALMSSSPDCSCQAVSYSHYSRGSGLLTCKFFYDALLVGLPTLRHCTGTTKGPKPCEKTQCTSSPHWHATNHLA